MKAKFVILAVSLQVLLLAYMAGEREWVLHFGQPVLLRTAPIDPNDPMRGYYARFNYDISSVPSAFWRDGLPGKLNNSSSNYRQSREVRDLRVYATLRHDDSGLAELVSLSDQKPAGGLFLAGRVNFLNNQSVSVRYGIEALFMQQGESQKLEDARRKERPGAPIDAEIFVGSGGLAVLKGYHWEPLGLMATFARAPVVPPGNPQASTSVAGQPRAQPQRPTPQQQRAAQFVATARIELKNYGPEDVALVALPDGGSFRLVPDARGQEIRYRWVGEHQTALKPEPDQVILLKSGQSHVTTIDLTQAQWFLIDTKAKPDQQKPLALRDVTDPWSASFRIEYAPPDKAGVTGLPHAELIRHAPLRSRAFNANQGVD